MGELVTDRGSLTVPERALVVCAHPDDVDFGAAGTVAALVRAGCAVSYCLVTSGDAGDDDLTRSRDELRALREAEQRAAAAAVGWRTSPSCGTRTGWWWPTWPCGGTWPG